MSISTSLLQANKTLEGTDEESEPKSYWKWSKVEFFPEESFQNWTTYATAISESGVRFNKTKSLVTYFWKLQLVQLVWQDLGHHILLRFPEGYNLLDPIVVVVLLITNTIAMLGTQGASKLNWIASLVCVVLICFVIIDGFVKGNPSNPSPFLSYAAGGGFQAAVLFWAYTGYTDRVKSVQCINLVYCLMVLLPSMLQKYTKMDANAAFSVAFQSVGMNKYLVAAGALKEMTSGLPVGGLGTARYTTQIARSHMIPPWFALLDHCKLGRFLFMIIGSSIGATVYYNRSAHESFVRFGICTLVMLVYYLFYGLHATYDIAHQKQDDFGNENITS
ncbi:hypothetical protein MKX01_041283 [Papaver californicum]|nr:hypothetical protein MKX01_041283 [Papaver californicum]